MEYQAVTANSIVVWLCWGFFMSIGWGIGSFLVGRATGYFGPRA